MGWEQEQSQSETKRKQMGWVEEQPQGETKHPTMGWVEEQTKGETKRLQEEFWYELGKSMLNNVKALRTFRAAFGLSPKTIARVWEKYLRHDGRFQPKHFLWTLHFLRTYDTQDNSFPRFCRSRDTYANYIWLVVDAIQERLPEV